MEVLARNHIGAVPVVDQSGRVVGLVSESDLMPSTPAELTARGALLAAGPGQLTGQDEPDERLLPTVDGVVGVKGTLRYRFDDMVGARVGGGAPGDHSRGSSSLAAGKDVGVLVQGFERRPVTR